MTFQDTYRNVDPYKGETDLDPERLKEAFQEDIVIARHYLSLLLSDYERDFDELGGNFCLSEFLDDFQERADNHLYDTLRQIERGEK